jgi:hypothetical protein
MALDCRISGTETKGHIMVHVRCLTVIYVENSIQATHRALFPHRLSAFKLAIQRLYRSHCSAELSARASERLYALSWVERLPRAETNTSALFAFIDGIIHGHVRART